MLTLVDVGVILVLVHPLTTSMTFFVLSGFLHKQMHLPPQQVQILMAERGVSIVFATIGLLFAILLYISLHIDILNYFKLWPTADFASATLICGALISGCMTYFLLLKLPIKRRSWRHSGPIIKKTAQNAETRLLFLKKMTSPPLLSLLFTMNVFEEFIWRGFLISVLIYNFALHPFIALAISAVAFGTNHFYYGKLAVVSHTISGIIFGAWFISFKTLLLPVVCHITYNCLSTLKMRKIVKYTTYREPSIYGYA